MRGAEERWRCDGQSKTDRELLDMCLRAGVPDPASRAHHAGIGLNRKSRVRLIPSTTFVGSIHRL